jgi:uncharacterized protein (DUF433 family)
VDIKWQDYIESNPNVLRGKPRIKGTRIPVSLILGYLAAGKTPAQIIVEFPDIKHDQISACLDHCVPNKEHVACDSDDSVVMAKAHSTRS